MPVDLLFLYARLWDVLWYNVVRLSVRALKAKPLAPGSYNLVYLISMMTGRCLLLFKVGGQRSRLYCHIIEKHCRQDTE